MQNKLSKKVSSKQSTPEAVGKTAQAVDPAETAYATFEKSRDLVFRNTQDQLVTAIEQGKRIVIVYQMGKVGSMSYTNSLEVMDDLEVLHVHRLNNEQNEQMIAMFLRKGMVRPALKETKWQAIANFIKSHSHQIYILSAMRNPVDRNISAFFHTPDLDGNHDTETLLKRFLASYSHEVPIKWFDEQFRDALGIDIYSYPFNRERGWDSFKHGHYNCLLMTAEISDAQKTEAINTFLGTNLRDIARTNIGASKDYADLYRKFKQKIDLPESYIQAQLNSKVVSHFYTAEQIEAFRLKWV